MKSYSNFPSQVVSDSEKLSVEYGLKVARAIELEWFDDSGYNNRYLNDINSFHKLRLYARGEQSIQKYKDELSINGDLSYLNLDWKPVPIIPKFVDIVVNGMNETLIHKIRLVLKKEQNTWSLYKKIWTPKSLMTWLKT